ncbi:MAG: hypothetical protein KAS66_05140 [Candidatus Omnitrophica bacterium]|nr:hypothetical protein [Candidatus Omnitrophota bacterium]
MNRIDELNEVIRQESASAKDYLVRAGNATRQGRKSRAMELDLLARLCYNQVEEAETEIKLINELGKPDSVGGL